MEAMAGLFKAYTARKRTLGVLDLDDLLLYWRALGADEHVGPTIGEAFDHILIDEYQDVNGLQVEIVRALRRKRRDVTAVGDDFQAIYGWRAASAEHILRVPEPVPGRGGGDARAQLPLHPADPRRRQRARVPGRRVPSPSGCAPSALTAARPELIFCRDESAQAAEVCERVLAARERGMELREQAVLSRTSHDTALLELELTRRRDPVRQVRRPALPRGRARQGPDRADATGRQPGRRDLLVPRSPAARGRRPGEGAAGARPAGDADAGRRLDGRVGVRPRAAAGGRARARRRVDRGAPRNARRALAPGSAPSACATRSRRSSSSLSRRRRSGSHDLDQLVAAARESSAELAPLRRRARARPAAVERRSRRPAAPRRGLPGALDDPLREGTRVARRSTCSRSTTGTSRPACPRARARASTRSAGCCTWR